MVCPCCYTCNCETTWLPREGGLTSVSATFRRLNCNGYEINSTLTIPQQKPAGTNQVRIDKYQQTSNPNCVSGTYRNNNLGAAYLTIIFQRCPLDLLVSHGDFYQLRNPGNPPFGQDVSPWGRCDKQDLLGQGLDESRPYMPFAGINIGTRADLAAKFITKDGKFWTGLGDACRSLETPEKSFSAPYLYNIPVGNQTDCVRTYRDPGGRLPPQPAFNMLYEAEITLEFSPLP